MRSERMSLDVGGESYKAKLDMPDEGSSKLVLFVPGISSGPWGDKYSRLAEAAVGSGFGFFRFESWEGSDELQEKTLSEIFGEIDCALEVLKDRGFQNIYVVGKSFGGGVALFYGLNNFEKVVLWAPAIGVGETSNIDYWLDRKLGNAEGLKDIRVGYDALKNSDVPVKVFHGGSDSVMDVENSRLIVENLENGFLEVLEGADHSYSDENDFEKVVEGTLDFLY